MNALRYLMALAALVSATAPAKYIVPVPSDVAVTLTATPGVDLVPGQPITFTLAVTNLGPVPVHRVEIISSDIYDQFDLSSAQVDCNGLVRNVVDTTTGFFYYYSWYPADVSDIAVGETRICHLTLALTAQAPAVMPLCFGLPSYYVDINPSNDSATVLLQQVVPSIPALSAAMLLLLAGVLAVIAAVARRRR